MSDDRLFASNNAIGRKWYYLNLLILILLAIATNYIFENYVIPNIIQDIYEIIAKGFVYFIYLIYVITFFSLIDRRLYDIYGRRDTKGYKYTSCIIWAAVLLQAFSFFCEWKEPSFIAPYITILSFFAIFFDIIFILIVFALGMFKGAISNLSYSEYRRKIKY